MNRTLDDSRGRSRGGTILLQTGILLVALIGFCSLAVDYGRVQVAKTELQGAADAAALCGVTGLSDGTAVARAISAAASNTVDATSVSIVAEDVATGNWNATTREFTPGGTPANAVRVSASRTAAKSNAVPLVFGAVLGKNNCDVHATAIATGSLSTDYALVGVDWVTMGGSSQLDSYHSDNGPYSSATSRSNAAVASNGNITLSGSSTIKGDADYGIGKTFSMGNASTVTGTVRELTEPLVTPAVTLPASYVSLGAYTAPGSATLSAGTYYATSFSVPDKSTLTINGDVIVYVNGTLSLQGNVSIAGQKPQRFAVRVMSNAAVSVGGNGSIIADVYAPQSALTIGGTGDVYGRYIGKSIATSGTGRIHFDEAIPRLIRKSPISLVR